MSSFLWLCILESLHLILLTVFGPSWMKSLAAMMTPIPQLPTPTILSSEGIPKHRKPCIESQNFVCRDGLSGYNSRRRFKASLTSRRATGGTTDLGHHQNAPAYQQSWHRSGPNGLPWRLALVFGKHYQTKLFEKLFLLTFQVWNLYLGPASTGKIQWVNTICSHVHVNSSLQCICWWRHQWQSCQYTFLLQDQRRKGHQ